MFGVYVYYCHCKPVNSGLQMDLSKCRICPRNCGANRRLSPSGYCRSGDGYNIAAICIHRGEEPVIGGEKGICNVFFSGCNMRCTYCQNHEISRGAFVNAAGMPIHEVLEKIEVILETGVRALGFVSPSHMVPQMISIIKELRARNYNPVTVYNTGGYDKAETVRQLEGYIDVYLPDFKYATEETAESLSDAPSYPSVALAALKAMYYQKGSVLHTDDSGQALNGILIRHLVLPGHAGESIKVLRMIAEEVSTGVSISLMSQYHPAGPVAGHKELGRVLYRKEYEIVVREFERLGFRNGYIQEMDSFRTYRPDFSREHPFEGRVQ